VIIGRTDDIYGIYRVIIGLKTPIALLHVGFDLKAAVASLSQSPALA